MPKVHDETDEPDTGGGNVTVHPRADSGVLNEAWAGVKGAAKGVIEPFTGNIPNEDKKSTIKNWVDSGNPDYPTADKLGRIGGEIAPLFALPDVEFPALAARGGAAIARTAGPLASKLYQGTQFVPRTGRVIGSWLPTALDRMANWGWKGAVGGASQSPEDRAGGAQTGAEWGIGSQALRRAALAMPHREYAIPLALAALAASWFERKSLTPWLAYHAAEAIPAATAVGGAAVPSGVAGALGEQVGKLLGGDQSQPDDSEKVHVGK